MKRLSSWAKVMTYFIVAAVVCSFTLVITLRHAWKYEDGDGTRPAPIAASMKKLPANTSVNLPVAEAYGRLPLSFEENIGQTAQQVRYVSHGAGYELFLTAQEAVLALRRPIAHDLSPSNRFKTSRGIREALRARTKTSVRMRFEGANPAAEIGGLDKLVKRTSYFIGNDPKKWRTDVPSFRRVKYAGIYPGVDLVFYGSQRKLEYDFIVAPGADPEAIRLHLEGAKKLRISAKGDVILSVPGGEVVLQKPVVYQIVKGERHEIAGHFNLAKRHQVTFSVPSYDRSEPLVLDPVLNYSTYLGGSSDDGGAPGLGIAVDATGNAYVAGTTFSSDFPTTPNGLSQSVPASGAISGAVFVTEMNPTGTAELYSTYLGGSTGELGVGLALDPSGNIYVTGQTFSEDFPTTSNALKQSLNTANAGVGTSFISKIDPSISGANSLVYSSYIGGTTVSTVSGLADFGNAIAADSSGNAYVTGITFSPPNAGPVFALTDFPVVNAFQATPTDAADGNAFLTRIDTTKSGNSSLIYSTYLGGTGTNAGTLGFADAGFGVAVDSSNNAYIIGATSSTDFPMTSPSPNGFQTTSPAGNTRGTAFVAKIDTTQSGSASLVYSTYLGGEVFDFGVGIGLGASNVAYTTGSTNSLLFPVTTGAFQTTGNATNGVAFVSLVDTSKTGAASLQYSTFLGGASGDTGNGVRADGTGKAYVVGATSSGNFPVTPGALEPVYPGAVSNGFLTKLDPSVSGPAALLYSTFFGGSAANNDQIFSVALDTSTPPNAYITGQTFSTSSSFPVFPAGAFQPNLKGTSDAFVAKLTLIPTLGISPTSLSFGNQAVGTTSAPQTVTLTNNTSTAIPFPGSSVTFSGTNAADFASPSNTCGASIAAGASCTVSVTFAPSALTGESGTLVITVTITNGGLSSSQSFDVNLTGTGTAAAPSVSLAPTSLDFGNQVLNTPSTAKTVTLTNTGNAALTINSISASGDFAATSTGATACPVSPATLSATANCTISVTFTPTALGARVGTLTITDNASGSPRTVPLTGNGVNAADFSIAAAAPVPATVKAGSSTTITVTVTPVGGFNSAVSVTCVEPAGLVLSTCTASPASITPNGAAVTTTVTVTTTAPSLLIPPQSAPNRPLPIQQIIPLFLAAILLLLLPTAKQFRLRLTMAATIVAFLVLAGCGSPRTVKPGTTPGTYSLTISGASGGTSHSAAPVSLTVN